MGAENAASAGSRLVLVVLHDALLGGATISVLRAVPLLERMGWRFAFWVPGDGPAVEALRNRGASVYGEPRPIEGSVRALRLPPGLIRRLRASPGYLRRFRRLVREVSPDVVHVNTRLPLAEAIASRRLGYPTVFHVHEMAPESWKARPVAAICRRGVDVTMFVSQACAASYGIYGSQARVVHEAVPIPDSPAEVRPTPEPFVVGTVGVIARRKGSDIFVEAAKHVLSARNGIELRLVGAPDDPLDREWGKGVVAEATLAGIRYTERADVNEELRSWDAFVLPSRTDPCPIALLEAMALGLPVIGSRTGGIPEQLAPGSGILVEPEDPEALARSILELAGLPVAERAALGAAARARAGALFGLERQAEGIDRAYEEAVIIAATRRRRGADAS